MNQRAIARSLAQQAIENNEPLSWFERYLVNSIRHIIHNFHKTLNVYHDRCIYA
jgi:hypothetical protein